MICAYALVWPHDNRPLFFHTLALAEENRQWFTKNYKRNSKGELRGEPFVVKLIPDLEPPK